MKRVPLYLQWISSAVNNFLPSWWFILRLPSLPGWWTLNRTHLYLDWNLLRSLVELWKQSSLLISPAKCVKSTKAIFTLVSTRDQNMYGAVHYTAIVSTDTQHSAWLAQTRWSADLGKPGRMLGVGRHYRCVVYSTIHILGLKCQPVMSCGHDADCDCAAEAWHYPRRTTLCDLTFSTNTRTPDISHTSQSVTIFLSLTTKVK